MGRWSLCLPLSLCLLAASAQNSSSVQAPQLPPGVMANGLYTNDALGVRWKVPAGWASRLSNGSDLIDRTHLDSALNLCSQSLAAIEKGASGGNAFHSSSILFVLNSACFPSTAFPASYEDRKGIEAFAGFLVENFRRAGYIPATGVDFDEEHTPQHLFVRLNGSGLREAQIGQGGKMVHVNTQISVTAHAGYWIGWASLVDDAAKKQLIQTAIQFKEN